jgi:hypothetical protein
MTSVGARRSGKLKKPEMKNIMRLSIQCNIKLCGRRDRALWYIHKKSMTRHFPPAWCSSVLKHNTVGILRRKGNIVLHSDYV